MSDVSAVPPIGAHGRSAIVVFDQVLDQARHAPARCPETAQQRRRWHGTIGRGEPAHRPEQRQRIQDDARDRHHPSPPHTRMASVSVSSPISSRSIGMPHSRSCFRSPAGNQTGASRPALAAWHRRYPSHAPQPSRSGSTELKWQTTAFRYFGSDFVCGVVVLRGSGKFDLDPLLQAVLDVEQRPGVVDAPRGAQAQDVNGSHVPGVRRAGEISRCKSARLQKCADALRVVGGQDRHQKNSSQKRR